MELSVCVAAKADDIDHIVAAERLGFARAWVADSQMLWSDCYATLALAADRTSTIGLGTGVAVAATRPAPVTAAAIATIARLAPGRTFCGIGTGNTAVRVMGHKPMRLDRFEEYLQVLRPLLAGEEVPYTWQGRTSPIRHLMADAGFVDVRTPIPLYVSGFGPRSIAIAGRHGDGLVTSVPLDPAAVARVRALAEGAASDAGRSAGRADLRMTTLTTISVLRPGEDVDHPRVRSECGPMAMASLHYLYDQVRQYGRTPPARYAGIWDEYAALVERTPPERRHLRVHAGHNCWVLPEEERFVTPELIEGTCLVGAPDDLVARLAALDAAGLDELMILPSLADRDRVLDDVGRLVLPRVHAAAPPD